MNSGMKHPYHNRVRKPPISLIFKTTFKQIVSVFQMHFKKHWINTGAVCLNRILQPWDMFFHTGLTELRMFFMTRSTIFLSSTVFIIFRLVGILSNKEVSLKKYFEGALKELRSKLATMLKMCCDTNVFLETWQNLKISYFNELFTIHAKQKPVEYSSGGVL